MMAFGTGKTSKRKENKNVSNIAIFHNEKRRSNIVGVVKDDDADDVVFFVIGVVIVVGGENDDDNNDDNYDDDDDDDDGNSFLVILILLDIFSFIQASRGIYLKALLTLTVSQEVLTLVLLALGGVAVTKHGDGRSDVPVYYIGPFIAAPLTLIPALVGAAIYCRGNKCENKREAAQRIGALMFAFCMIALFSSLGHLAALTITGNTGVCQSGKCSYVKNESTNRRLAITSIVFISLSVLCNVIGTVIICIISSSFGLKIFSRSRYQIGVDPSQTHTDIFQISTPSPRPDSQEPTPREHVHRENEYRNHMVESLHETAVKWSHPTMDHHIQTRRQLDKLVYKKKHRKDKKTRKGAKGSKGGNARKRNGREASYELPPLPGVGQPPPPSLPPSPEPPHQNDQEEDQTHIKEYHAYQQQNYNTQNHQKHLPSSNNPSPPPDKPHHAFEQHEDLFQPSPPPSSPISLKTYNPITCVSITSTSFAHPINALHPTPYSLIENKPRPRPMVVFVRSATPPSLSSSSSETPPSSGRVLIDSLKPTSYSPPPKQYDSWSISPSELSEEFPNPLNPNPHSEPPPPRPITPPLLKPTRLFVQPATHNHAHNFLPMTESEQDLLDLPESPDTAHLRHLYQRPETPPSYMSMITTRPLNDAD